jgi:zinc transporter 1/2/3
MTVFSLFFVELMTMRFAKFGHSHDHEEEPSVEKPVLKEFKDDPNSESSEELPTDLMIRDTECPTSPHVPGDDHLSHSRQHDPTDIPSEAPVAKGFDPESYAAQMTALAILEFGVSLPLSSTRTAEALGSDIS